MVKLDPDVSRWLSADGLVAVFDALEAAGGEVRVNGGAVRNALMGLEIREVDLSTTLLPGQTIQALESAGLKAVPTGFEHGTVTAISDHSAYEITTLREDIETDGRHAVVRFGTDWEQDARRRDLTINALYCDRDGKVFDPLDGFDDIEQRVVRFIGEAEQRITEDHLRILRFFRFFAWYGSGRPDGEGLKACARLKHGLTRISAERVQMELVKLLAAPDPARAVLWMRTTGVLGEVLPESEKWGIDLLPHLVAAENRFGWRADPLLRLETMLRPDKGKVRTLAERLKMSNANRDRLASWAASKLPELSADEAQLAVLLYRGEASGISDRIRLEIARQLMNGEGGEAALQQLERQARFAREWQPPVFPLKGSDLIKVGHESGPGLGARLKALEDKWVASGFSISRSELLSMI